jgi:hypothetical protein
MGWRDLKAWQKGVILGGISGLIIGLLIHILLFKEPVHRVSSYFLLYIIIAGIVSGATIGFWFGGIKQTWQKGAIVGGVWGLVSWMIPMTFSWASTYVPRKFIEIVMFPTVFIWYKAESARQYDTFVYFFGVMSPVLQIIIFIPVGAILGYLYGRWKEK